MLWILCNVPAIAQELIFICIVFPTPDQIVFSPIPKAEPELTVHHLKDRVLMCLQLLF